MNAQASLSSSHIERVAEELLSVDTAYVGLLSVHFEEEFSLYELRYPNKYKIQTIIYNQLESSEYSIMLF